MTFSPLPTNFEQALDEVKASRRTISGLFQEKKIAFQAGAASRDAYIEQIELALLQVRKAICGDIHNTDDLLDLIASRDAEVAKWKAIAANKADQVDAAKEVIAEAKEERNQLRAQINMLREALEYCVTQVGELATVPGIASALSSTPEQSLAEYRNKVIEEHTQAVKETT